MSWIAWLLAGAAAVCFGLGLVLTQFGLRHVPAGRGAIISVPASTALFWLMAPWAFDFRNWSNEAAAIFAAVGLLYPATATLLTFEANRRLGPNVAGALGNIAPLFAVIFAILALGEAPSLGQGAGIAAILAGLLILSLPARGGGLSSASLALPLTAAAIRGGIQPAIKAGLLLWPSPFAAVLIGYSASSLVVLLVGLWRSGGRLRGFNRSGVLWFAAVGLCNGLAVLMLYAALARGPVSLVAPIVGCYPIVTLLMSSILLGAPARITAVIVGVAATVAGVVMIFAA